jgi:hypothetical protein
VVQECVRGEARAAPVVLYSAALALVDLYPVDLAPAALALVVLYLVVLYLVVLYLVVLYLVVLYLVVLYLVVLYLVVLYPVDLALVVLYPVDLGPTLVQVRRERHRAPPRWRSIHSSRSMISASRSAADSWPCQRSAHVT